MFQVFLSYLFFCQWNRRYNVFIGIINQKGFKKSKELVCRSVLTAKWRLLRSQSYVNSFKKWRISGRLKRLGYFLLSYNEFALSHYYLFYSGYKTIFNGKEAKRGKLFIGVRPRVQLGETSNNWYYIWEARGEKLLVVVLRFIVNGTGYRLHPVSLYLFIYLFVCLFAFYGPQQDSTKLLLNRYLCNSSL